MKIKTFNQFNTPSWLGPLEILSLDNNMVHTNFGTFENKSGNKLTKGYSYILRTDGSKIVDTGMSCVDIIILYDTGTNYKVLSIKRGHPPFVGMWANPGGNIDEGEKPLDAAVRELEEETSLSIDPVHFNYIGYFDKPYRDPRNKNCVSHAFAISVDDMNNLYPEANDDAEDYTWNDVSYDGDMDVEMAFDHAEIIKQSIKKIQPNGLN